MAVKIFKTKKASTVLATTVLASLILTGCGEEAAETVEEVVETEEVEASEPAEKEVVDEEAEAKAEAEAAAEAEKKAEEEAAAAEKKAAEEAAEAEKKAAEEAEKLAAEEAAAEEALEQEKVDTYATNMEEHLGNLSDNMYTISTLSTQAGEDPYIMFDSEWITDFALELVLMDATIELVRAEDPPEALKPAHDTILKSMDEFEFVVDNMPTAIDELDFDLVNESAAAITRGSEYMVDATAQIEAATP